MAVACSESWTNSQRTDASAASDCSAGRPRLFRWNADIERRGNGSILWCTVHSRNTWEGMYYVCSGLLIPISCSLYWGGRHNFTFMRHKFPVLTVKKWLKSVYIYGSYRKVPFFWTTLYIGPLWPTKYWQNTTVWSLQHKQQTGCHKTVKRWNYLTSTVKPILYHICGPASSLWSIKQSRVSLTGVAIVSKQNLKLCKFLVPLHPRFCFVTIGVFQNLHFCGYVQVDTCLFKRPCCSETDYWLTDWMTGVTLLSEAADF